MAEKSDKPQVIFQRKENECEGFDSRWKLKKISIESNCQTDDLTSKEISTNTASTNEMQVQTDAVELKQSVYDENKLADWLKKIYPQVKKELEESGSIKAFKNYKPRADNLDVNLKVLNNIKIGGISRDESLSVSALSWNCTGSTIAVACTEVHESWCYHTSIVSLFAFNRDDILCDTPQKNLIASSCITSLRYHPNIPHVLAGGAYSGEIILWNTHNADENVIIKVVSHQESITQMLWVTSAGQDSKFLLASSSLDGYLNMWDFNATKGSLNIKEKFQIRAPLFHKFQQKDKDEYLSKKLTRGIISFDFSKFESHLFIVGTEGGLVIQCSMLGTKPVDGSSDKCPVSNPVCKYYKQHEGEITSVSFSPNRKEMFVTNGSDGEIRIYVLDQEEPAQIIFVKSPLQQISWVPHEEKILSGCNSVGMIEVYDILKGKLIENSISEPVEKCVLTQMDINFKRVNMVAVGSKNGFLQLWSVPWNQKVLNSI